MLTQIEIEELKNSWYTFEQIKIISDSDEAIDRWEFISEEIFWSKVYSNINSKMKEKCIK